MKENFSKESKGAMSDYELLGKKLGEGAYAVVREAKLKRSGTKVAIKTYKRLKLSDQKKMLAVRREIRIL